MKALFGRETLVCLVISLSATGCSKPHAPKMQVLPKSAAEALWHRVKSFEPVGEAVKTRRREGNVVLTTCSRAFSARMNDGSNGDIGTMCVGMCPLDPSGPIEDCQIDGCDPVGERCTPIACGGTCKGEGTCEFAGTVVTTPTFME